jgi:succinate dehydrogenase hydrophobic anchor subunit
MKTSSLLYRFVDTFAPGGAFYRDDVCSFIRGFFLASFLLIFYTAIACTALFFAGCFCIGVWDVITDQSQSQFIRVVYLSTLIVAAFMCGCVLAARIDERHREEHYLRMNGELPPKQPSILSMWLKDLHNKTCTKITFEK